MKTMILGLIIGLSLGFNAMTLASTLKTVAASSYSMTLSAMPVNSVKKFVDGDTTCYILSNGAQSGISCVQ